MRDRPGRETTLMRDHPSFKTFLLNLPLPMSMQTNPRPDTNTKTPHQVLSAVASGTAMAVFSFLWITFDYFGLLWITSVDSFHVSWLSPGKATQISHGRNPTGTIQQLQKNILKSHGVCLLKMVRFPAAKHYERMDIY